MSHWPRISVGGKYGTSIVVTGNLKALPRPAQNVIRKYFNRWRSLSDPTKFPELLADLRGLAPPVAVDPLAVDRYNKYLEIHTVVLSAADASKVIPGAGAGTGATTGAAAVAGADTGVAKRSAAAGTSQKSGTVPKSGGSRTLPGICALPKSGKTTPRIGAILRAYAGPDGAFISPGRLWEWKELIDCADGLVEYDRSFARAFAAHAKNTVAFLPSGFFKHQVEVGHHPKILAPELAAILSPHLEKWEYTERNGMPAARWLLKNAAALPEIAAALAHGGAKLELSAGAWKNAERASLISGIKPAPPPIALSKPLIAPEDYASGDGKTPAAAIYAVPVSDEELDRSMAAALYPFQRVGVRHLVHTDGAMLADDMGLGKTLQALAALRILAGRRGVHRALIICPASLKYQWKVEIERFSELKPIVIEGDRAAREAIYAQAESMRKKLPAMPPDTLPEIYIVNYELSFRDEKELRSLAPDAIILDEAQRIKNWQSKTHQAVVEMPARHRFVLTGTPLENELMELFNVMRFVDPEVFGKDPTAVRHRYTILDNFGGISGYQNLREASRRISGATLRRTREETLPDLPELVESYYWLELDPDQRRIYRDLEDRVQGFLTLGEWDKVAYDSMMTTVQRLREVCDTPEILFPEHKESAKLRELNLLLLEQSKEMGRQAIVFTQWTRMADILARELESWGLTYRYLHGAVGSKDRSRIISEFTRGEAQVFLSTDAGSAGLNLQAASIVVNFDLPFNPAVVDQRIARAHRMGQKSSVNAWHFVCRGTIEENLVKILKRRKKLFVEVLSEVGGMTAPGQAAQGREFLMELLGMRVPALGAKG